VLKVGSGRPRAKSIFRKPLGGSSSSKRWLRI
jgi:hypothetical protein